jgi:hypothetical protein
MYKYFHYLYFLFILNSFLTRGVVYGDGQSRICGGSCGGSNHCAWPKVTWPEVTSVTWPELTSVTWPELTLSGNMFCAKATGSCAISALMGPYDRKWQSHVTGRGPVRKWSWPEVGSAHARLFPPRFFLSSSNMATEGHLTPSGFPWVYATGSCATPVVTLDPPWKYPWGVLYDVQVL